MNVDVCISRYSSIIDLQETRRICEKAHPTWSSRRINDECTSIPESMYKCHQISGKNNQTQCVTPVECSVFACAKKEPQNRNKRRASPSAGRRRRQVSMRQVGHRRKAVRGKSKKSTARRRKAAKKSTARKGERDCQSTPQCAAHLKVLHKLYDSDKHMIRCTKPDHGAACATKLAEMNENLQNQEMFRICRQHHPTWSAFQLYQHCVQTRSLTQPISLPEKVCIPDKSKCMLRAPATIEYLQQIASMCEQKAYKKVKKCCTSGSAHHDGTPGGSHLQVEDALMDF